MLRRSNPILSRQYAFTPAAPQYNQNPYGQPQAGYPQYPGQPQAPVQAPEGRMTLDDVVTKTGRSIGLHVAQVMPQSPAARSGLRVGDIVVSVAGQPVASTTALQRTMVEDAIGRRLEITVWRNGALVDVIAVTRELTDA